MIDPRIEALSRALTRASSRHDLVRQSFAGGLAALLGERLGLLDVEAKHKRRRRHKHRHRRRTPPPPPPPSPLVFNRFGCIDVGQSCRGNNSLCCSGICEGSAPLTGQPDTSHCVAHNADVCLAGQSFCTGPTAVTCGTTGGGFCMTTTGNAGFCFDLGSADCSVTCTRDPECVASRGPGAACVLCPTCPGRETVCVRTGAP